jgi:hypothetical protein
VLTDVIRRYHLPGILAGVLALATLPGGGRAVFAQSPEKMPLTDDASRGQLFELMGQTIEAQTAPSDFTQFAFRAAFRFPHDAIWRNPVLDEDPRADQSLVSTSPITIPIIAIAKSAGVYLPTKRCPMPI